MQWKGTVPANQKYEHPIIALDLFATVVAQAKVSPKNDIDGKNLIPFLTKENKEAPHEELFWRMYDKNSFALIKGDLKLHKNVIGKTGLYNLKSDISEKKMLKDSILSIKLRELYKAWNAKNIAPIFDGLLEDKDYNTKHPDRYKNVEKY